MDRPLVMWNGSEVVIPHLNWRGLFGKGTTLSGSLSTAQIEWPGFNTGAYHNRTRSQATYRAWYGSVLEGQRDAGGTMYMRNRYYDPATGQFTQTDPIGIAGGLNTYGFAAGDPVSYADPYGLKVCARNRSMRRSIENTYQVNIQWDENGCAGMVTPRGGSASYAESQEQFIAVAGSSVVVHISWAGPFARAYHGGGSGIVCSAPIFGTCWINIDRRQARGTYAIDTPTGCSRAGPWGIGALIAHEFGHARGYIETGNATDESPGFEDENRFNRATSKRHLRSLECRQPDP